MRRLKHCWNHETQFSSGGEILRTSLMNVDLGGELILEVCLGLLEVWMVTYSYLRCCYRLCQKGDGPLGINAENSRKSGQYKAPSYFPHIFSFSFTLWILVKFGTYGKLFSRSIQCSLA